MRFAVVGLALVLSACGAGQARNELPPAFKSCNDAVAYYQEHVGKALVQTPTFTPHRVLPPNSIVTMDFNPQRLNVFTDDKGVITDARCELGKKKPRSMNGAF
ncbi:MAG TPA: I78 family peptidase inhibitor [Magnetovibrio sp.]